MAKRDRGEEQESEWTAAAVAGEREALERLLILYHDRLLDALRAKMPRSAPAVVAPEDALQEAYVQAFRDVHHFQPDGAGSFYRWLARVAENRLLDLFKRHGAAKRGGGRTPVRLPGSAEGGSVAQLVELVAVDSHTASSSAARREAAAAVNVALAGLKPDYREALRMRYLEGLSAAEIGNRLGRNEGAVHMLCRRALKHMRTSMGRVSAFFPSKG